ncbi:MAG: retropepsin-like aspartic protease family protein [Methylobacter sp.]
MGLQDRDYYRERNKTTYQSPNPIPRRSRKNSTGIKYLLYPLITIAGLWYGSDALLDRIKTGKSINPIEIISERKSPDLIAGGIILKADRQGHFRGTVLVNNIPMPFMIDTGATTTAIPAKMATASGLPFGRSIQTHTAGGLVTDRQTHINSLKIGNVEIRNLDAQINEHLDEVLIGMNTLKYFHITQNENTLTLVGNNQQVRPVASAQAAAFDTAPIQRPTAKPATLKKTVNCDEHKVCKITYSNR